MSALVPVTAAAIEQADDPTELVLAWCERGREALTEATSLDEGQSILAGCSTLEHATRARNLNAEVCVAASALRVRAERRMGELIAAERSSGRLAENGGARRFSVVPTDTEKPDTLADRGISRDQAAEYARLASAPAERFEEAVEKVARQAREKGGLNVTRSGVLRTLDPEAAKTTDERWLDADRFVSTARKLTGQSVPAVAAMRFGAYPGDLPLVSEGAVRILTEARAAIDAALYALRRTDV